MAPKKKAAAAAAGGDEEDQSMANFFKAYRRNVQVLGTEYNKRIKMASEAFDAEQELMNNIHIWDPIGWQGCRALIDALITARYPHLYSLRLWKAQIQDEGVRKICEWLVLNPAGSTTILDLLQCDITPIGCELLGKTLQKAPDNNQNLTILKLDHNPIGSDGFKFLAQGLRMNTNLKMLSLTYCQIGPEAAQSIFECCLYQNSQLEELNISGNKLGNEGITQVLKGLAVAKAIKKVYLADNGWSSDCPEVMDALLECMVKNKVLVRYDLQYNVMTDPGVLKLVDFLGQAPHVCDIQIAEFVEEATIAAFRDAITANKPKKGKKGKGKKKK